MKAKDVYYYVYSISNKSHVRFLYLCRENDIFSTKKTPWIEMSKEKHEMNIKFLEEIEKNCEGFMFWCASDDAREFYKRMSVILGTEVKFVEFDEK